MTQVVPAILCGGSGTRLWPMSRQSRPKQFAAMTSDKSLFQETALRLSRRNGVDFAAPLILTNADFRFVVGEQLQEVGIAPADVLIEPDGRNTAPAILAAALRVADRNPDALMLIAPSDHQIPDTGAFRAAVLAGIAPALKGRIVTFGIAPTRPETGFGYLELSSPPDGSGTPLPLERFVEKPDAARAEQMLAGGRHLWNAGIFLASVRTLLDAFNTHAPDIVGPVRAALAEGREDLDFFRLAPGPWAELPNASVDYAVMEKAGNLTVVPYAGLWSDLGGWQAVHDLAQQDDAGLATLGDVTALDCRDSLLRSEDGGPALVGIGLDNIVAVAMRDAVLVAEKSRAQEVKEAVAALKAKEVKAATCFTVDHRPWGHFETLVLADRFQVKRIVVKPGAALSLQSHVHRAEHWIVVQGTAKVTVGDDCRLLSENESVYIPLGAVHRLENPGKLPMTLIEVQTGAYLGEDDIIRYEDAYARRTGGQ